MEASSIIHLSDSIYSFPLDENTIEIRLLTKKDDDIMDERIVELLNKKIEVKNGNHDLTVNLNAAIKDFEKKGVLKKVQYPDVKSSVYPVIGTIK